MAAIPSLRWMDDLLDAIKNNGQCHIGTGVLEPRQVENALLTRFIWTDDYDNNTSYKNCVDVLYGIRKTVGPKEQTKKKLLVIFAANMTYKAVKEAGKIDEAAIMSAANAVARVTYKGIELQDRMPLDAIAEFSVEFNTIADKIVAENSAAFDFNTLLPRLEFSHAHFGELVEIMIQLAIVAKLQWWKYNHHLGSTDRKAQKTTFLAKVVQRIKDICPWFKDIMEAICTQTGRSAGEGDVVESGPQDSGEWEDEDETQDEEDDDQRGGTPASTTTSQAQSRPQQAQQILGRAASAFREIGAEPLSIPQFGGRSSTPQVRSNLQAASFTPAISPLSPAPPNPAVTECAMELRTFLDSNNPTHGGLITVLNALRRKIGSTWSMPEGCYEEFLKAMRWSNFAGPLVRRLKTVENARMLTSIMKRWTVVGANFVRYKRLFGKPHDERLLADGDTLDSFLSADERWYSNWDSSLTDYEAELKRIERERQQKMTERQNRMALGTFGFAHGSPEESRPSSAATIIARNAHDLSNVTIANSAHDSFNVQPLTNL